MLKITYFILLFCLSLFCNVNYAANVDITKGDSESQAFKVWINKRLDRYEIWREKQTQVTDKQKFNQIDTWGSSDLSNNLKSVDYTDKDKIKKVIDYEANTETFSILLNKNEPNANAKKILLNTNLLPNGAKSLKNAVITTTDVDYSSLDQVNEKKLILRQTQAQMNELDRQAEYLIMADTGLPRSFIDERVYEKKMKLLGEAKKRIAEINTLFATNRHKKSDNSHYQAKKIVSFTINLPTNALSKRAHKFSPIVTNKSKKWDIETALIMAIIHTESAFRPKAKSNVPAYGLMQIVPSTAGRDVNNLINKLDAPMKVNDLYQPEINIETGTAYLHILNKRYLRKIRDPKSRLYCMIAAYNTGAGNVARVFNADKSTNINKAFPIINRMSSEQVYQQLMKNLPYEETQNYLRNVYSRMKLYI